MVSWKARTLTHTRTRARALSLSLTTDARWRHGRLMRQDGTWRVVQNVLRHRQRSVHLRTQTANTQIQNPDTQNQIPASPTSLPGLTYIHLRTGTDSGVVSLQHCALLLVNRVPNSNCVIVLLQYSIYYESLPLNISAMQAFTHAHAFELMCARTRASICRYVYEV